MTERRIDNELETGIRAETEQTGEVGRDGPSNDRIGVGGGDENVAKLQLAARWAEQFAPTAGDTLDEALRRFKQAYNYVDSVTKLVDPDES